MSRQGQPTLSTCNIPLRKRQLSARWPRPSAALRWQQRSNQRPFLVRQIPATHDCSPKSSLESEIKPFGNPFCQHSLGMKERNLGCRHRWLARQIRPPMDSGHNILPVIIAASVEFEKATKIERTKITPANPNRMFVAILRRLKVGMSCASARCRRAARLRRQGTKSSGLNSNARLSSKDHS
jgi:hypothetical protein